MSRDDTTPNPFERTADDRSGSDAILRELSLPPLPPKQFYVEFKSTAIKFRCAGRNKTLERDGAVSYRVRWAEQADESSKSSLDAAYARSVIVATLAASGEDGVESTTETRDADYTTGLFFAVGVDSRGNESDDYAVSPQITAGILNAAVPMDVQHFQCSESGIVHDGVTYSELSVECTTPNDPAFAGVQLFFRHYQELNAEQEGYFHPYGGARGGAISFKVVYPIGRRGGKTTVTATNGNATVTGGGGFLTQAREGDQLEILGVRATVLSVESDTSLTLDVGWPGKTVAGFSDYAFIAKVEVYGVAISKGGTHRSDWKNSPRVDMLFDGNLSAPNAPTIAATQQGNEIRIDLTPIAGTQLDHYTIYRGTGAAAAFSACTPVKTLPADGNNTTGLLQWVDTDFSLYERENEQAWSYYATAVNVANEESVPSTRASSSCRLNAPGEGGPTTGAGATVPNLLFNSYIAGTIGNTVAVGDASQDYNGAAPTGFHRWDSAAPALFPGHQNSTEVVIPAPGAGSFSQLTQRVDAWDYDAIHATTGHNRIDKSRNLTLSVYLRSSSPIAPNGYMTLQIAMMNGGADVGYFAPKIRLSDDSFDYSAASGLFTIAGSILTEDPQLLFCTFSPQTIPANVDQIEVRITHWSTNNGNNLYVTKAKLAFGDTLTAWTPEMSTAIFPSPSGTARIPGGFPEDDGSRRGWMPIGDQP